MPMMRVAAMRMAVVRNLKDFMVDKGTASGVWILFSALPKFGGCVGYLIVGRA
jgi:hypothetical protein